MSIINALLIAWFLTLFDVDRVVVTSINEIFETSYSTNIYWLIAFIIGAIGYFKE